MCGIAGFISRSGLGEAALNVATAMTRSLAHRGPDGEGIWCSDGGDVALGHRRLAILDLTPTGRQPMTSHDQRWIITYNGEVYNFAALKADLAAAGVCFRGTSDTEVILEAIAHWGIEQTAKRLNGIFAFAAWDRETRSLWLVRDRFGIKPLYWLHAGPEFAFGSELKAIRAYPRWTPRINIDALGSYFQFNYIPAPHSIYKNVWKLWPGGMLHLPWGKEPIVSRYWDAYEAAGRAVASRKELDDGETLDQLEALLKESIRGQMISDVPLGALLSGGIDSSTVVALMQAQSPRPVRTFSIGFHATGFDEAPYAAAVAGHLGTHHEELYVDERQALDVISRLAEWYDEPFADSSQIPTYLVSVIARRHVTVALSGDGGDELFAGYPRYARHPTYRRSIRKVPRLIRSGLSKVLGSVDPRVWSAVMKRLPRRMQTVNGAGAILRLASVLALEDPRAFHRTMVTYWDDPRSLVPEAHPVETGFDRPLPAGLSYRDVMQLLDSCTYMIDDILVKVDRASMATALEVRVPLLDHRVFEFAWTLPDRMKIRDGMQKWALRNVLYRHVPPALIDRPKSGFGIPIEAWLRSDLRHWCEALLDEKRLRETGFLAVDRIRRIWQEHRSGARNHSDRLWAVLQLQSWLQTLQAASPPKENDAAQMRKYA